MLFIIIEEYANPDQIKIETKQKTKEFMTPYEKTALIIYRANQLATGMTPLVPYTGIFDAKKIATQEIEGRLLKNYIIRRTLPDGNFEDIDVNNLIILN